jgi:hypothetical protein
MSSGPLLTSLALAAALPLHAQQSPAGGPSAPASAPTVQLLTAEVERLYADWRSGHLERAVARFARDLRARTSAEKTGATLQVQRDRMGEYVGLDAGSLRHAGTAEGRPLVVLDVTVRHARASSHAYYGFVFEEGAWRLRAWGQATGLPDETTAPAAARALLDGVVRDGPLSVLPHFSAATRELEGEAQLRRKLAHLAAVYGPMRSYTMAEPAFATLFCRDVKATVRFDGGGGRLTMQVCSDGGAWLVETIDIAPEVVTGGFFQRAMTFELAQKWPTESVSVSCPDVPIAVGGEVTCRIEKGAERAKVRVRRTGEASMRSWARQPSRAMPRPTRKDTRGMG